MSRQPDGTYKCSCGAVYTLETLPEKCTGTRDGNPCGVFHFGDWARANARMNDAADNAVKKRQQELQDRLMYGDQSRASSLPFYGKPKWMDPAAEVKTEAEVEHLKRSLGLKPLKEDGLA